VALPKIFRLTKAGKLIQGIFEGATINTPSMLAVEDAVDGLTWAESVGGLEGLIERSKANLAVVESWVAASSWAAFLAEDPATRSSTSMCLRIIDPWAADREGKQIAATAKAAAALLDREGVAYDIGAYRDAPAGFRLWGGATVETSDLEALLPWLDWAWSEAKAKA
jgi:phosphoserine aminotransferase